LIIHGLDPHEPLNVKRLSAGNDGAVKNTHVTETVRAKRGSGSHCGAFKYFF
jgi:hypothetical protein